MPYDPSRVAAWNQVASASANKVALDNINRVLQGQTQTVSKTRKGRVVKGSALTANESVGPSAAFVSHHSPNNVVGQEKQKSVQPKLLNGDPSKITLEAKYFDARSVAASNVVPSSTNSRNGLGGAPASQISTASTPPHLRNKNPTTASRSASKSTLCASIKNFPPNSQLQSGPSHAFQPESIEDFDPQSRSIHSPEWSQTPSSKAPSRPESFASPSQASSQADSTDFLPRTLQTRTQLQTRGPATNGMPSAWNRHSHQQNDAPSTIHAAAPKTFGAFNPRQYRNPRALATGSPDSVSQSKPEVVAVPEPVRAENTSISVNSGAAAKSAGVDAEFSCSYDDCGMGFSKLGMLRAHKRREHDGYCDRCDLDTPNNDTRLEHKKTSAKHICCQYCGADFFSEGGRNLHEKQSHPVQIKIHCFECGRSFSNAASLFEHGYCNQCTKLQGRMTEKTIRESRIKIALLYDAYMHEKAVLAKKGWDAEQGSTVDDSSAGGVELESSLLDSNITESRETFKSGSQVPNFMDDAISNISGGSSDTTRSDATKKGNDDFSAKLHALNVENGDAEPTWANKLFEGAPITPVPKGAHIAKANTESIFRTNTKAGINTKVQISGSRMKTDWDHYEFGTDFNGHMECPFQSCVDRFVSRDALISHAMSSRHFGNDYQCPKCHKRFQGSDDIIDGTGTVIRVARYFEKPPLVRLMAHMESNSIGCGFKTSYRYGHFVHILSGGYLGVKVDDRGRVYICDVEDPQPMCAFDEDDEAFFERGGDPEW